LNEQTYPTNASVPARALELHKTGEHLVGINGDEEALAAGEDFVFVVEDLGHVDVLAAFYAEFAGFDVERLFQGNRLQILDGDFGGQGDDVAQFIYFAHGFVEDGGDDATVAVSGRSGVALGEAKFADKTAPLSVVGETQAHAVGIAGAASEAAVFLELHVARVVSGFGGRVSWAGGSAGGARLLGGHPKDSIAGRDGRCV
jgi:hypothetical protein